VRLMAFKTSVMGRCEFWVGKTPYPKPMPEERLHRDWRPVARKTPHPNPLPQERD